MIREDLQTEFKQKTGLSWKNSQGEPDIDYVMFLEEQLIAVDKQLDNITNILKNFGGMEKRLPDGIPGMRDPDNRCSGYTPRKWRQYDPPADCETDGHYLCNECAFKVKYLPEDLDD